MTRRGARSSGRSRHTRSSSVPRWPSPSRISLSHGAEVVHASAAFSRAGLGHQRRIPTCGTTARRSFPSTITAGAAVADCLRRTRDAKPIAGTPAPEVAVPLERRNGHPSKAAAPPSIPPPQAVYPQLADDVAEEAVTYRRLAVRVIQRAFKDITAPACPADDRRSAREFLAGSPMLFHWCSVAALDPRRVIAKATTLRSPRSSSL